MDLENEIRKETSIWRMVLWKLFDIIISLTTSSLALRGYWEDFSLEGYHEHFYSIVQLVFKYNHVIHQVFKMPKGSEKLYTLVF